jgi:hypothetical protein
MMKELLIKFNELKLSEVFNNDSFTSTSLDNNSIFRLAIDENQNPTILISESHFSKTNWSKKNYRFEKLEIKFNVTCNVVDHKTGITKDDVFTIIKQINGNSRMHEYFLSICEVIINALYEDLNLENLNYEIEQLIKLFSSNKKIDEKIVLGLWGELIYILNSKNIETSISAWHLDKIDLFDFSLSENSYEIKTTTKNSRIHEFNNLQLKKFANLNVYVVSILTEKMALGKSVMDLWGEINSRINAQEIRNKVTLIISETIGSDMTAITQFKYNYLMATSTMKEFNSKCIPSIDDRLIPSGIIEVKLKINLDLIE